MAVMTCAEKLADATAKYHEIRTGQAVNRFVDQNGEQVQYQMANIDGLKSYIRELQAECGEPTVVRAALPRPLRFTFGRRGCF